MSAKGVNFVHLFNLGIDYLTIGASVGGLRIGDMLVQLFFFLVLLAIVKKFAWGPLMEKMEEREKYVAGEIDAAEKSRVEAEAAAKEAKEQLDQVRAEAQKMIEDAKATAAKQEQEIVQAARQEAERMKREAEAEIQNEKEKALQAVQDKVASLSVLIASKVIEKEINAQDQEKLISDYIKEVGEER